jgi:hypothetical protein
MKMRYILGLYTATEYNQYSGRLSINYGGKIRGTFIINEETIIATSRKGSSPVK